METATMIKYGSLILGLFLLCVVGYGIYQTMNNTKSDEESITVTENLTGRRSQKSYLKKATLLLNNMYDLKQIAMECNAVHPLELIESYHNAFINECKTQETIDYIKEMNKEHSEKYILLLKKIATCYNRFMMTSDVRKRINSRIPGYLMHASQLNNQLAGRGYVLLESDHRILDFAIDLVPLIGHVIMITDCKNKRESLSGGRMVTESESTLPEMFSEIHVKALKLTETVNHSKLISFGLIILNMISVAYGPCVDVAGIVAEFKKMGVYPLHDMKLPEKCKAALRNLEMK